MDRIPSQTRKSFLLLFFKKEALACLLACLVVTGCKRADMVAQGRSSTWDRNDFFADQSTMRHPVAGTVPRAEPNLPAARPPVVTAALLARGQERFDIFCSPCHGRSGDGRGMIVSRGFPQPPDLAGPEVAQQPSRHVYDVITAGQGVMYSYADRVPPTDRWAIAAYIRALQLGRSVDVAQLTPDERARIGATR